ncbi:MAG: HlyC/CorC family transporter [Clostridia bacterium]|nr:HlyC/CorC family transporter [Clostridia bacterium]
MEDLSWSIMLLLVLITFSAYFSATETAFSSLNRIRLKNDAQKGDKRAQKALDMCEKYDKLLSTILIGNNIVNIMSTSVATALFVVYFPQNGVALSTVVMTIAVLIFGEILPKSMAKEKPEAFAKFSAPLISVLLTVLTPVNYVFSLLKAGVKKLLKIDGDNSITDKELLTMVEEAKNDGGINEDEGHLLISAIEFYDLDVSDILTPRVDVVAVDIEDDRESIKTAFRVSGFSRLPVYRDTVDNIIGIINEKDFHYAEDIQKIISPAVFVLENMKISKVMTLLQHKKSHLAVVTDEYGGTVGVVSLEDIIEELVGEIWDEHDLVKEDFCRLSANRYKVSGNASVDKMFEVFGLKEDEEIESTTVSGWITEVLGRIPEKGENFDYENLTIIVTKAEQNRVVEVMITKIPNAQEKGE